MRNQSFIYEKIPRIPDHVIEKFRSVPSSIVSDVMGRGRVMDAGIKCVFPNVHVAGQAVTVSCEPGNNLFSHKALYLTKPGDILVIDAEGGLNRSVWGGVQTEVARQRDVSAVIIDGLIRDVDEIRRAQFPVFCRGAIPSGPFKDEHGDINVPIRCGGMKVEAGDLIIADDDGVAVLPHQKAAEILKDALRRMDLEQEWLEQIGKGKTTLEVIGLDENLECMDVRVSKGTWAESKKA